MKTITLCLLNIIVITALQAQSSKISASKTEGCTPLIVSFESTAADVAIYEWDFGNGKTSNVAAPTLLFEMAGSFSINLKVTKTNGQTESIHLEYPIKVVDKPKASFIVDDTQYCINTPVSFSNSSTGAISYFWDFGDESSSTETNPIHVYKTGGQYSITLIAYNELECTNAVFKNELLLIHEIVGLDFQSNTLKKCLDDPNVLFNTSKNYASWHWDFGDGQTGSGNDILHTYDATGKYTVTLTVENLNGCSATLSKSNYIEIFDNPAPIIVYSETIVCSGSTVLFENKSSNTSHVSWQFSDGYTTTENTFERTFNSSGIFDLIFTLHDTNGCSTELVKSQLITVYSSPAPLISISENEGCTPFTTIITNNTPEVTSYEWIINGKNYNGKTVNPLFNKPGVYKIKAIMQQISGCIRTVILDSAITVIASDITIAADTYAGCIPFTTNFSFSEPSVSNIIWDFGNGSGSSSANPSVTYNKNGVYPVRVTFTNQYGCVETLNLPKPITAHDNSIVYPNSEPIVSCESVNVFFSGGMGKDFWEWNFGDGNTSTDMNPSHSYSKAGVYVVSLKTNNQYGCETEIDNYNVITVSKITTAFISSIIDTTAGCPNFTVRFDNKTNDANSYLWNINNDITSNKENFTADFATNSQLLVNLTTWNSLGCSNTAAEIISSPWLYCTKSGDSDAGENLPDSLFTNHHTIKMCSAPSQIKFANPRNDAHKWLWDFGDGNTSKMQFPDHTYQKEGTYYVTLISYYADGKVNTLKNYSTVIIKSPTIDFEYSTTASCTGTTVKFTNSSDDTVSWDWNFGNGSTSTLPNPEIEFLEAGVYQVGLKARDTLGCEVQMVKNLIIGNPYMQYNYPKSICAGELFTITHNIEGYSKFEWAFGDNKKATGLYPSHQFSKRGSYVITLTLTDAGGCTKQFTLPHQILVNDPLADFGITGSQKGCNELPVKFKNNSVGGNSWFWDFGNGETSTNANPSTTFLAGKYDVTLIAGQGNCYDTLTQSEFIIVDHLKADFSFVQNQICLPFIVNFTNESENALEWSWDFGDGTFSSEKNPTHTYFTNPQKEVVLTVNNKNNCSESIQKPLKKIFEAQFTVNKVNACLPFQATFEDTSTNAVSWFWDFGDGGTSILKSPDHIYLTKGEFTVTLIAQSATGCYDTLTSINLIKTEDVQAAFTATVSESTCAPLLIQFSNKSIDATKYYWDFGDESTSTSSNPFHIYSDIGQFDVQLIAENSIGCKDTLKINKLITSTGPSANFALSDSVVCHPQSVQFNDLSVNASKWLWFFGDGNVSEEQHPSYTYASSGKYEITLIAHDDKGCEEKVNNHWINVIETPVAKFEVDDYNYCLPVTVNMTNSSTNLQNEIMEWEFGNNTTSTANNPSMVYTNSGTYNIALTVTNEGFCSNTFQLANSIIVYDTIGTNEPEVFSLSVINQNSIEVLNKPYIPNNFKYNLVYRQGNNEKVFEIIDTLWTQDEVRYYDEKAATSDFSYTYKIQSNMYCHVEAQVEDLTGYKSILLNTSISDNHINLSWTGYKGHLFDQYSVMRRQNNDSWIEIAVLPSNALTYEDTEDLCPDLYDYQVKAVHLNGTEYASVSNSLQISPPKNVFLDQKVTVIRSTVEENKYVFTEWAEPEIGPDKVDHYEVYKSEDGSNFEIISKVPKGVTSFYDENVDVQSQNYTYRIGVINTCEVKTKESNIGHNILLQKQSQQYLNNLFWNPYQGWEKGIKLYFLQRMDEYGQWQNIQELDSTKNELILDLKKDGN